MDKWQTERNKAIEDGTYQTADIRGLAKRAIAFREEIKTRLKQEEKKSRYNFRRRMERLEEMESPEFWQDLERKISQKIPEEGREKIKAYWRRQIRNK